MTKMERIAQLKPGESLYYAPPFDGTTLRNWLATLPGSFSAVFCADDGPNYGCFEITRELADPFAQHSPCFIGESAEAEIERRDR
jgi:hypothetical protein